MDHALAMSKHRRTRLGFAVLLAFFGSRGRFPRFESAVEQRVIDVLGEQLDAPAPASPCTVHPRACGEHDQHNPGTVDHAGSSPRVRGTPGSHREVGRLCRFIPARAGNTGSDHNPMQLKTVHPRACGEHGLEGVEPIGAAGSSPRVRGTRRQGSGCGYVLRFIPARAGNTLRMRTRASVCTVHPRACGEHPNIAETIARFSGSSPRVRGTP